MTDHLREAAAAALIGISRGEDGGGLHELPEDERAVALEIGGDVAKAVLLASYRRALACGDKAAQRFIGEELNLLQTAEKAP